MFKIKTMERDIIHINEELCTGCGICIPNCQEGALQLIDNKARLVSELMCDGLGACIGHCPEGAITIEHREARAYNETAVIAEMATGGKNLIIAHLRHLNEHQQEEYVKEGLRWLTENREKLSFNPDDIRDELFGKKDEKLINITSMTNNHREDSCSCPGSAMKVITRTESSDTNTGIKSELRHWPVQFHLINPAAAYFKDADILLSADCAPFAYGDFHGKFIRNHFVINACPKLDQGKDIYLEKLIRLIEESRINTIHVALMEVPCCGGLLHLVKQALQHTSRKVPVKCTIISTAGEILSDNWI